MKRSLGWGLETSFVFCWMLASIGMAEASTWSDELKSKIDSNVRVHFSNESQVGIVIGVVKGNETYFWSYGEKEFGKGVSVDPDTYFEMGSITKTFTATLLSMEVLNGSVSLHDPVSKFLNELDGLDAGKITLQELASHTSGLPRMPSTL